MKEFIKKIVRNPIYYIFLAICIFALPFALFREPDSTRRLIVHGMSIDKVGDQVEVSVLGFIPLSSQTFEQNYKVFSAKSDTFSNAIGIIGLHVGKRVALNHTSVIVVNQQLMEEGLYKYIDQLERTSNVGNNTVLLGTDRAGKEILTKVNELDKSTDLSLNEIISFNSKFIYSKESTIGTFYKGYFSPSETSFIGHIKLSEQEGITPSGDQGGGQSASGSQSGGASGGGAKGGQSGEDSKSQNNQKILNDGSAVALKKGKFVTLFTPEQVRDFNYIDGRVKRGEFKVEGVSDEKLTNATITYDVKTKRVFKKLSMKNGIPVYDIAIFYILNLDEIKQENIEEKDFLRFDNYFSENVKIACQNKIRDDFSNVLSRCRENKVDIFGIKSKFEEDENKEFQKFLDRIEDPDDFLSYVQFNIYSDFVVKT